MPEGGSVSAVRKEDGGAVSAGGKETSRRSRAIGAVLGSAVGDALGAPFEFGPEGVFSGHGRGRRGNRSGGESRGRVIGAPSTR